MNPLFNYSSVILGGMQQEEEMTEIRHRAHPALSQPDLPPLLRNQATEYHDRGYKVVGIVACIRVTDDGLHHRAHDSLCGLSNDEI